MAERIEAGQDMEVPFRCSGNRRADGMLSPGVTLVSHFLAGSKRYIRQGSPAAGNVVSPVPGNFLREQVGARLCRPPTLGACMCMDEALAAAAVESAAVGLPGAE